MFDRQGKLIQVGSVIEFLRWQSPHRLHPEPHLGEVTRLWAQSVAVRCVPYTCFGAPWARIDEMQVPDSDIIRVLTSLEVLANAEKIKLLPS